MKTPLYILIFCVVAVASENSEGDDKSAALAWLVRQMGPKDRAGLSTGYVLEHIYYAFIAAEKAAEHWGPSAGTDTASELFLNFVLPYSCINERRDAWREDFHGRLRRGTFVILHPQILVYMENPYKRNKSY